MRATLMLTALGLLGCAQNAVLEIEMQLPTRGPGGTTGAPDALVRVALDTDGSENDAATFDAWNDATAVSIPSELAFSLSQNRCAASPQRTFPCNARLSVATGNVDADVIVQIRFCNTALGTCDNAPELRYHIEHPFYRAQRTYFRTGPETASSGSYTYNVADDFPELCQQPAAIDQATHFIWRCRVEGCFDNTHGQLVSADYGWCATATGPTYAASDACTDGAAGPDAGEHVVGLVAGHPQHQCELRSGCSIAAVGTGRSPITLALVGLMLCARKRTRRDRRSLRR